jgi:hypothetical protein
MSALIFAGMGPIGACVAFVNSVPLTAHEGLRQRNCPSCISVPC